MSHAEETRDPTIVAPRGGVLHVLDAARYSAAGSRRLMKETAARLELSAGIGIALAYLLTGAALWHWLATGFLLALVLAVEALNTAIEVLCDRVSPEWSQAAKDAKDLGSLAVALLLLVAGGFVASGLIGLI
ncbi:diacylglycerol kinase [Rhodobacter sp. NTK016B]|uniref:diacylglycerol kinase n=1 Tax=Rhodobacter sp. NTK016B TaxID=2759676 RepID=UPI001A8D8DA3|nr:diacylglycerol kinase [Rhodobacter sp. NTK016B]MBN8291340.1 diacylglycerol kinase [Rhodobacter sp. NTK016B]